MQCMFNAIILPDVCGCEFVVYSQSGDLLLCLCFIIAAECVERIERSGSFFVGQEVSFL